jgi:hypothetical protein
MVVLPRPTLALVALVAALPLVAACGDESEPSASRPLATAPQTHGTVGTGDTVLESSAEVVRFDAPAEVPCTSTATVAVSYATRGVDAIGFVVDGAAVSGPPAPTSGTYEVSIPCDGRVHTILLAGSGSGDPVFATKAVATRPT